MDRRIDDASLPQSSLVELQNDMQRDKETLRLVIEQVRSMSQSLTQLQLTLEKLQGDMKRKEDLLLGVSAEMATLIPVSKIRGIRASTSQYDSTMESQSQANSYFVTPASVASRQTKDAQTVKDTSLKFHADTPMPPKAFISTSTSFVTPVQGMVDRFKKIEVSNAPQPTPEPSEKGVLKPGNNPTISDYKLYGGLGSGTYGAVFHGLNNQTLKECALKIVSIEYEEDVRHEIKALRILNHPNIVQCRRSWVDEINLGKLAEMRGLLHHLPQNVVIPPDKQTLSVYCLEMELCRKGNLRDYLQTHPYNAELSRLIFGGIINGIRYMHGRQMIHRDLKPENIFIDITEEGNPVVKVGDVGLAKFKRKPDDDICVSLMYQTHGIGTPMYRAPEQADSSSYGRSVDIFPLGIILFELSYPKCNQAGTVNYFNIWNDLVWKDLIEQRSLPVTQYLNNPALKLFILNMTEKDPVARPKADEIYKQFGLFNCLKCTNTIRLTRKRCVSTHCVMTNNDYCMNCFRSGKVCNTGHQFQTFEMISFPL